MKAEVVGIHSITGPFEAYIEMTTPDLIASDTCRIVTAPTIEPVPHDRSNKKCVDVAWQSGNISS